MEHVDDRPPQAVRSGEVDVVVVEIKDEHAVARIGLVVNPVAEAHHQLPALDHLMHAARRFLA